MPGRCGTDAGSGSAPDAGGHVFVVAGRAGAAQDRAPDAQSRARPRAADLRAGAELGRRLRDGHGGVRTATCGVPARAHDARHAAVPARPARWHAVVRRLPGDAARRLAARAVAAGAGGAARALRSRRRAAELARDRAGAVPRARAAAPGLPPGSRIAAEPRPQRGAAAPLVSAPAGAAARAGADAALLQG